MTWKLQQEKFLKTDPAVECLTSYDLMKPLRAYRLMDAQFEEVLEDKLLQVKMDLEMVADGFIGEHEEQQQLDAEGAFLHMRMTGANLMYALHEMNAPQSVEWLIIWRAAGERLSDRATKIV